MKRCAKWCVQARLGLEPRDNYGDGEVASMGGANVKDVAEFGAPVCPLAC
jgi:hypothetical protein